MILGSLFQDGAVFQRNKMLPVWGETLPGVMVKAEMAGHEVFCRSSKNGEFTVYLPAMAAGGPFELQVSVPGTDEAVTVRDILIGEVWLASGQSNMSYPMGRGGSWSKNTEDPEDCTGKIQHREFNKLVTEPDKLRMFTVEQCASSAAEKSAAGSWQKMTAANSGTASAVAAWYGWFLQQELDVPVGLIVSAWGGTVAEAWSSVETLLDNPETMEMAQKRFASNQFYQNYSCDGKAEFKIEDCRGVKPDPGISETAAEWAKPDFDDSSWKTLEIPNSWIRADIAKNGAVWVRKTIELPADWVGCELELHLGGVDKHDISFVNGVEVGRTGSGLDVSCYAVRRVYPVASAVNNRRHITVAVRGFSFAYDGSFMGEWFLKRVSDGATLSLNCLWKVNVEFDWGLVNIRQDVAAMGHGNQHTPGILFDGMIHPLIPYALRGVIWYQGESNAARYEQYYGIMRNLVRDWSYRFREPDMPFLTVQLAGYGFKSDFIANNDWAFLRESQRQLACDEKNVYMATAVDVGELMDIHPQDKKIVGWRLAQCALNQVYGCADIVPSGPEITGAASDGDNRAVLSFRYAGGLRLDFNQNQAFYVSGNGSDFYPADSAKVEGDQVVLTCQAVKNITEVRYAWSPMPPCTLTNGAGLAAASFRVMVTQK